MAVAVDKSEPYFPLAGAARDGWSKEDEAKATCFCGAVQLAFVSLLQFISNIISSNTASKPLTNPGPGPDQQLCL